jgi:choline dehydrogenase-like flavoprotein
LTIRAQAKVFKLETNGTGKIERLWYHDMDGENQQIEAELFVIAAQAVETSRLLLMSKNIEFPNGLANNNGQVGKNLIFSAGGIGSGYFYYNDLPAEKVEKLKAPGVFVNRSIQKWYEIDDMNNGDRHKGGIIDFLFEHANASAKAIRQKWNDDGSLLYGTALKQKLKAYFTEQRRLKFEVFNDWLPTDDCFVTLDPEVKDKWGDPVARIRLGYHEHDLKIARYLTEKAEDLLKEMGAQKVSSSVSGSPPPNLQAGGCRFGDNPETSVLDKNCKAHEVDNLYITDGSFMPTGGSVTFTWTIFANSFRVADKMVERLKKQRAVS